MERYSVYEGHMEELMKKVKTIQNKCRKLGCDFHFAEVGEEIKEVKDLDGNPVKCKFIIVEAEGTAVINGWEFVASVEHTKAGNIFSKAMSDVEIPERYRTSNPICEHCNSNRMRKDTFIVRNTETGEFKQVGKSCLKDFTFGMSASTAVWFASIKDVFEEYEEKPVSGMYFSQRYFDTRMVLQYTAETIRHFGYTKTSDRVSSTATKMEEFLKVDLGLTKFWTKEDINAVKKTMDQVGFNHESEEAVKMAEDALEWIQGQEATNDYLHNLKVVSSLKETNCGRFGILVSLFPTYNKDLELQARRRQEAEEGKISEHVGQVGDRLQIEVESVKCVTSWEYQVNAWRTTTTYIWKITDKKGNIFTWKTSNYMNEEEPPKSIKGTVKEHKVFRDVKQTELTRCKIQ